MGEIDPSDIYNHFKPYREDMRAWIHDISEGESAFDTEDINKRPYKIVYGEIVVHNNKHVDKDVYKRQGKYLNDFPCISNPTSTK